MTRKDYVAIARAIAETRLFLDAKYTSGAKATSFDGATEVAYRIAHVMALDNPRFDRARFLKACGISA